MKETKRKTPQEKKALSYERDRHTQAWHTDKGLRIARRRRKATANQQFRRRADAELKDLLKAGEPADEETRVTNALVKSGLIKKRLRKILSAPLREAIARKQEGRRSGEERSVRQSQRDDENAKAAISFLGAMNKKTTLLFIDGLVSLRRDYSEFHKLKRSNPELGNAIEWARSWGWITAQTGRFARSNPEWATKLDTAIKNINRIAQETGRSKQRGPSGPSRSESSGPIVKSRPRR
jgi:hypothetical protein